MAAITVPVVNVNGLNKRDDLTTIGTLTNWKDLNVWMEEQERYFDKHRIESDEKKIDHVIMNLDVSSSSITHLDNGKPKTIKIRIQKTNNTSRLFSAVLLLFTGQALGQIGKLFQVQSA